MFKNVLFHGEFRFLHLSCCKLGLKFIAMQLKIAPGQLVHTCNHSYPYTSTAYILIYSNSCMNQLCLTVKENMLVLNLSDYTAITMQHYLAAKLFALTFFG